MRDQSGNTLAPLVRIGWRSIGKAPLRSLLIFTLVAVVVAAGTFAAIANRSTSASPQDLADAQFGSSNFLAEFSANGFDEPTVIIGPNGIPIPAPQVVSLGEFPTPSRVDPTSYEAQRASDQEWLTNFDLSSTEQELTQALGTDVSIARRSYVSGDRGPFGSRGWSVGALSDLDMEHPQNDGVYRLLDGRTPRSENEIAVPQRHAANQPEVGDQVTIGSTDLTVVGLVTGPANRFDGTSIVTPATFDKLVDPAAGTTFTARGTLAGQTTQIEQAAQLVSSIVGRRIQVRTPTTVLVEYQGGWVSQPIDGFLWEPGSSVSAVWPILITGLLATQIALVCAAAFAVGIRRRTKEFGQLMTLGADDRHIRRLAHVEATLLGILAALFGLVAGIVAGITVISAGWLDQAGDRIPDGIRWSIIDWLGPAAVGIVAVVAAAWWPTRALTGANIPSVLDGRLPSVSVRKTTPRWGLALVVAGAAFLALGSDFVTSNNGQLGGAYALLLVGIITMVAGAVLLIGTILSAIGRRADRLPLLPRLATRNSDRQRSRSWVVVGAFIAALAIPVLIGASIKAYPNSYSNRETSELEGRLITTTRVAYDPATGTDDALNQQLMDFDADFGDLIATTVPVAGTVDYLVAPLAQILYSTGTGTYWGGGRIVVATDELVDLLGLNDDIVEALQAGHAVDVSTYRNAHVGEPRLSLQTSPTDRGAPIAVVDGPALFGQESWLMAESSLVERGVAAVEIGRVRLLEQPLDTASEATIRQLGNGLWADRFGSFDAPYDDGEIRPWLDLVVSNSYSPGVSANQIRLWSTLAATVLAVLVALVTSSLSAVEMTTEIESMIATGASPSIRRRLLGFQTLYHLFVAAALAIPLALLAFWVATRADDYGRPSGLVVPWSSLAITGIVIPVVVAVVVTLTFRNGKPAVSRRMS